MDQKTNLNLHHVLRPNEGGLGWIDGWCLSSGIPDRDRLELAYKWINFRLAPENMAVVAISSLRAPCVNVHQHLPARYAAALFLDQTGSYSDLYQIAQPSDTSRWSKLWSDVEAA